MNGDKTNGTEVSIEKLAAFSSDGHSAAKHRLRGSCAHTHDKLWPNNFELCLQPGPAGYHLAYERFLVHTSLATLYPLEVLDCIGYVNLLTGDPCFGQGLVKQASRRSDERMALPIFLISRLLSYKDDTGILRSLAENGLSCIFIYLASFARTSRVAQSFKRALRRQEICRGVCQLRCHTSNLSLSRRRRQMALGSAPRGKIALQP